MSNRKETLLDAYKNGTFLHAVYEASRTEDDESVVPAELVIMHNEGLIDIVAAFKALRNDDSSLDFFFTRMVFERTLPGLQAPVPAVMDCASHLYTTAGQDLAAGDILTSFAQFCAKDPLRPPAALKKIEERPDAFIDLTIPALQAGSQTDYSHFLKEVIRLIADPRAEIKQRAVFSLASFQWPDGQPIPTEIIEALDRAVEAENDDQVLASIVPSAYAIWQKDKSHEDIVLSLIDRAIKKGGDLTLHRASLLFAFDARAMPPSLLDIVISSLPRVSSNNNKTVGLVGTGIRHLIRDGETDRALKIAEDFLVSHADVRLENLVGLQASINRDASLMRRSITRWLLSGTPQLCRAAVELVGLTPMEGRELDLDADVLATLSNKQAVFLGRKIIGYIFLKPISAVSLFVSLLNSVSDKETHAKLAALLVDPLLVNYTGQGLDYIKRKTTDNEQLRVTLDNSIKATEEYLATLHSIGALPALRVPQANREAYRRHMSSSMAESFKRAEKNSILLSMVSRSTVLYGRGSINYIYAPDGQSHRTEIQMQSHGVSYEVPRMEMIDPFGLDYMLRVFKAEKMTS